MNHVERPTEPTFRAGDVVHLTRAASVQFVRPIVVRVIRELTDRHSYHGWEWVEGYEVSPRGTAVAKRELFVMPAGVRWLSHAPVSAPPGPARARPDLRRPAASPR
ncbi:hypothetical protein [Micromonospora sp. WMMD998]|uniref:hypothetical protein n=1 Tax=Micromonospora sp. WMMD998 TaxID=3016092 RepID=UPI00249CABBF|nr:hypothetical protein [Micromonospora sp. WMMD998]WFE41816.1 hypothetical protein O7619_26535 [Micromonospora sp. WMMD998]